MLLNWVRLISRPAHRTRVKQSRRLLRRVRGFGGPQRAAHVLSYLRKIDPYVLEELVLSALEDRGCLVLRNRRYSGDGGVDGHVRISGSWWPIQVKRYGAYIDHQHVSEFVQIVSSAEYGGGLFVHTGLSGSAVYRHLRGSSVYLISGDRLVEMICAHATHWP
ncbi:restriction endonuclease [Pseudoduganella buxea]